MIGVNEELSSADKGFLSRALAKEEEQERVGVDLTFYFPNKYNIEPIGLHGSVPHRGDHVYFRQWGSITYGEDPFSALGMCRWKVVSVTYSITSWNKKDVRYLLTPNVMRVEIQLKRCPFIGFYRTRRVLRAIRGWFRSSDGDV